MAHLGFEGQRRRRLGRVAVALREGGRRGRRRDRTGLDRRRDRRSGVLGPRRLIAGTGLPRSRRNARGRTHGEPEWLVRSEGDTLTQEHIVAQLDDHNVFADSSPDCEGLARDGADRHRVPVDLYDRVGRHVFEHDHPARGPDA